MKSDDQDGQEVWWTKLGLVREPPVISPYGELQKKRLANLRLLLELKRKRLARLQNAQENED